MISFQSSKLIVGNFCPNILEDRPEEKRESSRMIGIMYFGWTLKSVIVAIFCRTSTNRSAACSNMMKRWKVEKAKSVWTLRLKNTTWNVVSGRLAAKIKNQEINSTRIDQTIITTFQNRLNVYESTRSANRTDKFDQIQNVIVIPKGKVLKEEK